MALVNTFQYQVPAEMPIELKRMSDRSISTISSYPKDILRDQNSSPSISLTDPSNFVNPAANVTWGLSNTCNSIIISCSAAPELIGIVNAANTTSNVQDFIAHTNRLSGQSQPGTDDTGRTVPYLMTVSAIGKAMAYKNYIKNGVLDDTLVANNFSAVLLYDEIGANNTIMTGYVSEIANSVSSHLVTMDEIVWTSNLTTQRIATMTSVIETIGLAMSNSIVNDEAAFLAAIASSHDPSDSLIQIVSNAQQNLVNSYINQS